MSQSFLSVSTSSFVTGERSAFSVERSGDEGSRLSYIEHRSLRPTCLAAFLNLHPVKDVDEQQLTAEICVVWTHLQIGR